MSKFTITEEYAFRVWTWFQNNGGIRFWEGELTTSYVPYFKNDAVNDTVPKWVQEKREDILREGYVHDPEKISVLITKVMWECPSHEKKFAFDLMSKSEQNRDFSSIGVEQDPWTGRYRVVGVVSVLTLVEYIILSDFEDGQF